MVLKKALLFFALILQISWIQTKPLSSSEASGEQEIVSGLQPSTNGDLPNKHSTDASGVSVVGESTSSGSGVSSTSANDKRDTTAADKELLEEIQDAASGEPTSGDVTSHASIREGSGTVQAHRQTAASGSLESANRGSFEEKVDGESEMRQTDEGSTQQPDEAEAKGYEELQDVRRSNVIAAEVDTSPNSFLYKREIEEDFIFALPRYPFIIAPVAPSDDLFSQGNDLMERFDEETVREKDFSDSLEEGDE